MVTIVNYQQRESEMGDKFFSLIVQGGVEMVQSKETSSFYATAKKASITSTFDEDTCKSLLGTQIPGKILKLECSPYNYTVKETGEVIELSHRYQYVPEEPPVKEELSEITVDDLNLNEDSYVNKNHPLIEA